MEQRKLSDQANTLVDLSKVGGRMWRHPQAVSGVWPRRQAAPERHGAGAAGSVALG